METKVTTRMTQRIHHKSRMGLGQPPSSIRKGWRLVGAILVVWKRMWLKLVTNNLLIMMPLQILRISLLLLHWLPQLWSFERNDLHREWHY